MFTVEARVRARGGRLVWVKIATLETAADVIARYGHLADSYVANDYRVRVLP